MKINKILIISLLSLSIMACNNGASGSTASSSNGTTSSSNSTTTSNSTASSTNGTTSSPKEIYKAFVFNAPGLKVYNVVLYNFDEEKEEYGILRARDVNSNKIYNGTWRVEKTSEHYYIVMTIDGKSYWGWQSVYRDSYYVYGNLDDAITELDSDRIGQVHHIVSAGEKANVLVRKWGL